MGCIRLVTFNLQGLAAGWFEGREQAVIEGLRRLDPDVVLLQEASIRYGSGVDNEPRVYNQARAVGDGIGHHFCAFAPYGNPIETMSPQQGGLATVSRLPIVSVRSRRLPSGHRHDGRVALLCSVQTSFGEIELVNTHLSWRPEETETRLVQLGLVLEEVAPAPWRDGTPRAVLAGDLNAEEGEAAIALARQRLRDAWRTLHPAGPGTTWATWNGLNRHPEMGDRRLDYVFCPPEVEVRRCEVVLDEADPHWPSDHFGVLAELEWSPGADAAAPGASATSSAS
ncbi:endonuclease/exonuclease/phosphatase family protein [Vulgatibacter sp.]|uniref:endonuclease/exonuclease/phosphatase family protein n=1 Tax=Vulgatibacter sp. TaxID=1971226 RepID=UPI0035668B39